MRLPSSPFLHREGTADRHQDYVYHEDAERGRQEEYRERSRITLERLWYKYHYLHSVDRTWRVIQRLGNSVCRWIGVPR